jgi:hypothetical protein
MCRVPLLYVFVSVDFLIFLRRKLIIDAAYTCVNMFNFQLASFYLQDNFQFDIENRNRKKPKKILTKMRKNLKCTESHYFRRF